MASLAQPGRSRREVRLPAPRLLAPHADSAGATAGRGGADRVVALADRTPVRRTHPRQARHYSRSPRRRSQQAVRRPAARHDSQHHLALLPRHNSGGHVHRSVAKPCDQARRLALPRSALAGRLHQRLETVGGDQGTGLSTRIRKRPRLRQQDPSRQAPTGRPPATIRPRRPRWILTHPDALPESDRIQLKAALANCPELTALAEHVHSFAHMLTHLHGDQLPEWIEAASATTELPSLRRIAQHLLRDLDAVTAGLTLPWNSGVVEGHVNRIKMLKRQMFGLAGFELLRKRVLLYP
ncbi:transposase [Streptomyces sp. NPDC057438]|uniref:transposase n=1 Tax=Streptomyces sp. NPDC057438 TaxID=3346133 RepID=UPI0036ADEECE